MTIITSFLVGMLIGTFIMDVIKSRQIKRLERQIEHLKSNNTTEGM